MLRYFLSIALFLPKLIFAQGEATLQSPDGSFSFSFYQKQRADGGTQMYYSVTYKNAMIIEESELGVLVDNKLFEAALGIPNDSCRFWCDNMELAGTERSRIDETWKPVYGEKSEYRNRYNEMVLQLRKGSGSASASSEAYDKRKYYCMNIVVRAYNEGVAFRYAFPETSNGLFLHITGEQTQFTLPEGTLAYYEVWAQGPYSPAKLEGWTEECERPLTLKLANGLTVALAEAELTDYARMKFALSDKKRNTLQASLYGDVDVIAPYRTPWRVIMAAETATTLIENNHLMLSLNEQCQIKNTSWIKPGKAIRVTRLNQSDALRCVDFAAERGLQYVHLDAGWYGKEFLAESDATKVDSAKNIAIEPLVEYANSRNIGVFLYVNQRALSRQLDEILPLYKKWGVKGIKFGFVQVGSQHWTAWLHNAVKQCAQHELMVDIHDEYRPTGFSRTYPNLLTQEGIRGNEEFPDATHNTILPFTRFLAGAGDYTICYFDPRLKTTHAHQLALSVVCYSPLQFLYWYDTPDSYSGEPEVEFFDNVPTVWDETKIVAGQIGEYIVAARKSGSSWFVGAITNNESREISIPLSFLERGKRYSAQIYADDEKVATRTKVAIAEKVVDQKEILNFHLKASGGVAIRLFEF
jgi:alpha-glucosidase